MGCDIHLHQEVKIDGRWEYYGNPRVPRNYPLFTKMAGVRGVEKPIVSPRGVPADATAMTKFHAERERGDAHTHSWLSRAEILELIQWMSRSLHSSSFWSSDYFGYYFGDPWEREDAVAGVEDFRFVFWFDN